MNTHLAARVDHVGLNLPERDFAFWQEMLHHLGFEILYVPRFVVTFRTAASHAWHM